MSATKPLEVWIGEKLCCAIETPGAQSAARVPGRPWN